MEVEKAAERALTPIRVGTSCTAAGRRVRTSTNTPYKNTGGIGKYEGASGGGTYSLEELTDTLLGGRYKQTIELP